MAIHVICIGTELLVGQTVNTNLAYLGAALAEHGLAVAAETCIPDAPAAVRAACRQALGEARVVITVGGLGPTQDDLTKEAVADVLAVPLREDPAVAADIRAKYAARRIQGRASAWQRQATVPVGATVLPNEWGTAPGLWCPCGDRVLLLLPGPPRELQPMFAKHALPRLLAFLPPTVVHHTYAVFGVGESVVEQRVLAALAGLAGVAPAYCIKDDRCLVRLAAAPAAAAALAAAGARLAAEFGADLCAAPETMAGLVAASLRERGWRLATAESCTGGGLGYALTEVPGVSDVYAGGVVTYADELKVQLLGVSPATLAREGAVSEAVAREMVQGLLARYGVQAGIAVTGIAGPAGGSPAKPVGTVHVATAVNAAVRHSRQLFPFDRRGVRERTIILALNQLRLQLCGRE